MEKKTEIRSAEEIALRYGLCACDEIYTKRGLVAPDCPLHSMGVEEAMKEYAEQFIDKASEVAVTFLPSHPHLHRIKAIDKKSILKLKEELK